MTKLIDSVQEALLQRFANDELNEIEREQIKILLRRFVRGELDDIESERVMAIVGEHDHCMDVLDTIWLEEPIGQALASTMVPDSQTSDRLKEEIIRALHRADMAGMVVKFGVTGFGAVAASLFRPFIKKNSWQPRRNRRTRR